MLLTNALSIELLSYLLLKKLLTTDNQEPQTNTNEVKGKIIMPKYDWVIIGQGSTALNFLYAKFLAEDSFKEYELQIIKDTEQQPPTKGKNLVIVWKPEASYYARIFDGNQIKVIDKADLSPYKTLVNKLNEVFNQNKEIDKQTKKKLIQEIISSLVHICVIGEADLWTSFYDLARMQNLVPTILSRMIFNKTEALIEEFRQMFSQLNYEIGQALNLDYTLNWWNTWMNPQQWNINDPNNRFIKAPQLDKGSPEYFLVGQYSYLQQRLLEELQKKLKNLSLCSGEVDEGKVMINNDNNDNQTYPYSIEYKKRSSNNPETIIATNVIIATGVPTETEPRILCLINSEKTDWENVKKQKARWNNKKLYRLAWNATDYVVEPQTDTISISPDSKEKEINRIQQIEQSKFNVLVDGGTPTGAWAAEKAFTLGAAKVIWIRR